MLVSISEELEATAVTIAKMRLACHKAAGTYDDLVDRERGNLQVAIDGAIGEYAVAKALNVAWDGDFKDIATWHEWRATGHDVSGLEVKTTNHPKGCLVVRPKNNEDHPYVLVILDSKARTARLAGWAWGFEAKTSSHWMSHWKDPAYALQQRELQPMSTLAQYRTSDGKYRSFTPTT